MESSLGKKIEAFFFLFSLVSFSVGGYTKLSYG